MSERITSKSRKSLLVKTVQNLMVPAARIRRGSVTYERPTTSTTRERHSSSDHPYTASSLLPPDSSSAGITRSSSDISMVSTHSAASSQLFSPTRESAELWQRIHDQALLQSQRSRSRTTRKDNTENRVIPVPAKRPPHHQIMRKRSLSAPEHDVCGNMANINLTQQSQIQGVSNGRIKWNSLKGRCERRELTRADTSSHLRVQGSRVGILNSRYLLRLSTIFFPHLSFMSRYFLIQPTIYQAY